MQKKITFTTMLLSAILTFGCKRCYQCIVVNDADEFQWGFKELCERPKALEDYEKRCEEELAEQQALGDAEADLSLKCKCGENLEF